MPKSAAAWLHTDMKMCFRDYMAAVEEGLLVPDRPAVPGVSPINTSLFPRSRYKINKALRPPAPPKPPAPPSPGIKV
jgi:hypothetical protein